MFLRVKIEKEKNVFVIRFNDQDTENPPYKIINQTNYMLYFRQKPNNKIQRMNQMRTKLKDLVAKLKK